MSVHCVHVSVPLHCGYKAFDGYFCPSDGLTTVVLEMTGLTLPHVSLDAMSLYPSRKWRFV